MDDFINKQIQQKTQLANCKTENVKHLNLKQRGKNKKRAKYMWDFNCSK